MVTPINAISHVSIRERPRPCGHIKCTLDGHQPPPKTISLPTDCVESIEATRENPRLSTKHAFTCVHMRVHVRLSSKCKPVRGSIFGDVGDILLIYHALVPRASQQLHERQQLVRGGVAGRGRRCVRCDVGRFACAFAGVLQHNRAHTFQACV